MKEVNKNQICGTNIEEDENQSQRCGTWISEGNNMLASPKTLTSAICSPSVQSTQEKSSIFKDFAKGKNVRFVTIIYLSFYSLLLLIRALLIFSTDSEELNNAPIPLLNAICWIRLFTVLGMCVFMLALIQKVTSNREQTDKISWLTIGSSAISSLGIILCINKINSIGLGIIMYWHPEDEISLMTYDRFMTQTMLGWEIISCLMTCLAYYLIWKYAYKKYKSALLTLLIACIILLISTLLISFLSTKVSDSLSIMASFVSCVSVILYIAFYIMLISKGADADEINADEKASVNHTNTNVNTIINKSTTSKMDLILQLKDLVDAGILTQDEFTQQKSKILNN